MANSQTAAIIGMLVTLEVFSGRPNPSWTLSAQQATEFQSWLQTLKQPSATPPAMQPLGYGGFTVDDGTSHIRVFAGRIDGAPAPATDPGRGLELWLLKTGTGRLEQQVESYVRSEITGTP